MIITAQYFDNKNYVALPPTWKEGFGSLKHVSFLSTKSILDTVVGLTQDKPDGSICKLKRETHFISLLCYVIIS